ncbi:MAG TPA: glycosyltransferase [Actinomycetota bacterium]|nr:glycosyltransferase [Actinomycetota bacterium]
MTGVLLLIKGLGRGGAEQLLASASRHLDAARFRYEVAYLLPWKDALVGAIEAAGLPTHCLDGGRGVGWVRRLRELVRDRRIELVHAHSPVPAVAARTALPRAVHQVYTEHNVWARYRRPTYWANLVTFGRNDHVFAVSDEVRASIRYPAPLDGLRRPPVETLYHGLDWSTLPPPAPRAEARAALGIPDDAPVIGTVGNLTAKKDHATLLAAAVVLRRSVPGLRVVVVGTGPLEEELRRRRRELGLEEIVLMTGFRDDAPRLMGAFDAFVLSSRYEGLPIALLEAMALGIPAAVTSVGGNAEVLTDGTDGLLVPSGDAPGLAEAVGRLLGDEALRRRLGDAARRRAADFDIRAAVRRMEEVYGELMG